MTTKKYVLDTCVCLTDANSLFSYEDNDIIIPFKVLEEMLDVLKNPFQENVSLSHYSEAPSEQQRVTQTFCGT